MNFGIKTFNSLVNKVIVPIFPVIFGGLAVYTQFVDSSTVFLNLILEPSKYPGKHLWDYQVNIPTVIIWLTIPAWWGFYVYSEWVKDKESEQKFMSMIAGYPNFKVGNKAKLFLEKSKARILPLQYLKAAIDNDTITKEQLKDLKAGILAVSILIKNITADFFSVELDTISSNFMLYFSVEKHKELIDLMISKAKTNNNLLHFRENEKLIGILYLAPELYDPVVSKHGLELIIPVYDKECTVYSQNSDEALLIPGAPTAFYNAFAKVGDTTSKTLHKPYNEATRNELKDFFTVKSRETKSVVSMRVPISDADCLCVFNMECPNKDGFDFHKNFMDSFTYITYPMLAEVANCLSIFKVYKERRLLEDLKPKEEQSINKP